MGNILVESIAFQEHEDWKKDITSLLDNQPIWQNVKDAELENKLNDMLNGEVSFVPSIYRNDNGKWEVDIAHAYYSQLPDDLKRAYCGLAEKALYHVENLGKGLSSNNRVRRCYENALKMLSAKSKTFEGEIGELLKAVTESQQKRQNVVYRCENQYIFTKFDNIDTIYAKIYGMSKEDRQKYECLLFHHQAEENFDEILHRGKRVTPFYLHNDKYKDSTEKE